MSQIPIYTIGHGQYQIGEFIAALQAHDIAFLIDVRSAPYSRHQPAFSKQALDDHLRAAGIRYVYLGDSLGGRPDDPAVQTNGRIDYDKLAQQPAYQQGIARLQDAFAQQRRVALMCAERKPEQCHRSLLIGRSLAALDIPVAHIDENGRLRTQADVEQRLAPDQPALFGEGGGGQQPAVPPEPDLPPPPPNFDEEMPPEMAFIPEDLYSDDGYFPDYDDLPPLDPAEPIASLPAAPTVSGAPSLAGARRLLKEVFGFDSFRPLQADVIETLLDGGDATAVMPTGSGKSLCYQLPALLFPGLTVVVSPLLSLMADQVAQLREFGVPAVALNSTLSLPEYSWTVQQVRSGQAKLLYAAPETLVQAKTLALLDQVRVDCLTIDEAHCISEWGHDFRPEYRQLTDVRRRLPEAVCLAVTATATERVREDIKRSLDIPDAGEHIASFDRKNLFLAVEPKTDILAQSLAFLADHKDESGIIYCATRKQVDELAAQLQGHGWDALPYHAGLSSAKRADHQRRFSRDDTPIIVATIAFGMGINKSNVRFILHVDLPKNLESYYQQIGRAGRDGLRADCLLLYSYGDVNTINYFISQQAQDQQVGARVRLEAMLAFVESNNCRRRPLLTYFDEAYPANADCEMCDNCTQSADELVDLTVPAQKFLSCVKRTGELYGVNHIIDVLRGSRAKKVLEKGHDRLSTYNIGGELSKKAWRYLARQFVQQDLLTQDMTYGSLKLTPKAYGVFQGEQVLGTMMALERPSSGRAQSQPHDTRLFGLLRAKRKELADAANLPPYTIFSDRTLVEMATYFPQSTQRFATLYGVGAAKLAKYADVFLPIIGAYCEEHDIDEKRKAVTFGAATSSGKSRRREVVELWNDGRGLADIADHFQVKLRTVIGHMWKAVLAGEDLRPGDFLAETALDAATQQQVLAAFAQHGSEYLRPVYDAMNETVAYDDLALARLYLLVNNP